MREHEVYTVGIGTDAARRVLETGSLRIAPRGAAPRLIGELTDARPFGLHRLALLAAPVLFVLMVGGGVAVRAQVKPPAQAQPVRRRAQARGEACAGARSTELVAAAKPEPAAAPKVAAPAAPTKAEAPPRPPTPMKKPVAKSQPAVKTAAAQPAPKEDAEAPARVAAAGVIQLAILPWGEVFVNGKSRGVSPPLRAIELPPGAHTIEVRNTSFPVHTQRVEVRSGEPVRIRHQFR